MCRPFLGLHLLEQFPEHAAEAVDSVYMRAVWRAWLEPDGVVRAENVTGTIHEKHVIALLERARGFCGSWWGRRGFYLGFGRGWHGPNVGLAATLINPPESAATEITHCPAPLASAH